MSSRPGAELERHCQPSNLTLGAVGSAVDDE